MIYMPGKPGLGPSILILEQAHFDQLKIGESVFTPDKTVVLMFTPDAPWLAGRLRDAAVAQILSPEVLDSLHQESLTREHNPTPPKAPLRHIVKNFQPNEEML